MLICQSFTFLLFLSSFFQKAMKVAHDEGLLVKGKKTKGKKSKVSIFLSLHLLLLLTISKTQVKFLCLPPLSSKAGLT